MNANEKLLMRLVYTAFGCLTAGVGAMCINQGRYVWGALNLWVSVALLIGYMKVAE